MIAALKTAALALGYVWAAPLVLVGVPVFLLAGARDFRWRDGHLEAVGAVPFGFAAQTWGWVVLYDGPDLRERPRLRAHEAEHVRQALIGGPLFALAYGALWLYHFAFDAHIEGSRRSRWYRAYWRVWFEKSARRAANEA